MVTVTTRAGKGSELSHAELDANFNTLAAAANFATPQDTAFATTVPLSGLLFMPQQSVAAVLAFTPAAGALKGSRTHVRLIANGTHVPTFTGFKEAGGSAGWDNRASINNQVEFFFDGYDHWYFINQQVGAVVSTAATGVTLSGPSSGVVGSASTAFAVGVTPLGGTITGTLTVTPSDAGGGGTFTPTSVGLTTAAPTASFTYTPASSGAKTISVTNSGGLTNPGSITYTASASATAPGAPTIGTATAGDASASVTFTAPASDGGSAITSYTVISTPGSLTGTGSASPINVAGLTNGTAYTFTVTATNSVGSGAASAASNSVTPAVAGLVVVRQQAIPADQTESGDAAAGWTYTANASGTLTTGSISTLKLPAGADGFFQFKAVRTLGQASPMLSFKATQVAGSYGSGSYGIYVNGTNVYKVVTAGTAGDPTTARTGTANDMLRIARSGLTISAQVSSDDGATWSTIHTWTAAGSANLWALVNCATVGTAAQNIRGLGVTA